VGLEFGVLHEIEVPEPHTPEREQEYFQALVEMARIADESGYHSVWHVEHHFLKSFSHSSNSDVILGAYASATKNIRIGYGVKLLPFNFNHPIRAAEAGATLDLMSAGRLEFGTGRGLSRQEWEGFNIDPDTARAEWRESLEMIVKCWEPGEFSWDSPSFKVSPSSVVPKPLQQPHPPLWMACASPDSHEVAGRHGLGLLSFAIMVPLDEVARRVDLYRRAIAECADPIGKFRNNRASCFTNIYCGETNDEAAEVGGPAVEWYCKTALNQIARMAAWLQDREGERHTSLQYLEQFAAQFGQFDPSTLTFEHMNANDLCIIGDVDTCIEKVKKYQEAGIDLLLGQFQMHGIPLDKVKESMERFGKEVMPAFR
jgi:alkanesulfonate monooxygenase SsuD/methylene tetrahydromethanopterin reductase-like flavin-dependent oxidoreductase (luciferase family)